MALAVFAMGCGGGSSATLPPEPTFANTALAERTFHRIEARFAAAVPETRAALERDVLQFLGRFPTDGRARQARAYLAWLEVESGRAREGGARAHEIAKGPPGVVRDFALVVEAAALRRQQKNVEALRLLLPLEGKIVDANDRSLFSAEFIQALVAVGRFDLAIRAMLDWADQTPPADREAVIASIEGLIRTMPTPALEAGFRMLDDEERNDTDGERSGRGEARRWLHDAIRAHLVRTALAMRDSALARRLVETSRPGLDREQTREALSALAASSAVKPRVAGRTIGVVLDVTDSVSRARSAAAVAGMTRALGLPLASDREDSIRLATRDAAEASDVERALAALAGDGAVILVAGVSDDATVAASVFAEHVHVPVITLRRPPRVPEHVSFTFALGTNAEGEEGAVSSAISELRARSAARVGPGGAPCDSVAQTAGGPRFPVQDWKRIGADALVLAGDVDCTRDAVAEATGAGLSPALVLGLESADAGDLPGRKLVIAGGRFPFGAHELRADERAWVERWGAPPSWFEVLGHDAALLAASALSRFPTDQVEDSAKVEELHRRARDNLARAVADLWSTRASGFRGHAALERDLAAVPLPEKKGRTLTELVVDLPSRRATTDFARAIAGVVQPGDLYVLAGPLGAGKTFLVRAVCRALGLDRRVRVTSPTFTLVHEYETVPRVVHADVYRVGSESGVFDLGLDEQRDQGNVLFVEWGNAHLTALGGDAVVIELSLDPRRAHVSSTGPVSAERAQALRSLTSELADA